MGSSRGPCTGIAALSEKSNDSFASSCFLPRCGLRTQTKIIFQDLDSDLHGSISSISALSKFAPSEALCKDMLEHFLLLWAGGWFSLILDS
jgi:hypothetical protein